MDGMANYFLLFFVCAVFGWLMEVACKLVQFGRFVNRGFLQGPYCPIYGCGAVLVTVALGRHADEPVLVFFLSMVLCGTLEYATSYLMEKLFHAKWWDYENKKFNLNGRVCASTLIPFGVLGTGMVCVAKPFLFERFDRIPSNLKTILCAALAALMLIDAAASFWAMSKVTKTATLTKGDNTETLTYLVRQTLLKQRGLQRRLLRAYPTARLYNARLLQKIHSDRERFSGELKEIKRRLREDMDQYIAAHNGRK